MKFKSINSIIKKLVTFQLKLKRNCLFYGINENHVYINSMKT